MVTRVAVRRVMVTVGVVVGLVAVAAGACGDAGPSGEGDAGPSGEVGLGGRTFLSEAVTEAGVPRPLVDGTQIRLEFHDDGRLTATAGCNILGGSVDVREDRIVVADLSTTEIGCDPARHAQDEWLARFLALDPAYRLDGNRLQMEADQTVIDLVDRRTAEPDRPLEGTEWRLDGIIDGDTVGTVPVGVSITLGFGDRRVTLHGSCNQGAADFEVSGDELRMGPFVTTDVFCGEPAAAVEAAVAKALRGTVTYSIEASTLTLTNPNGAGLLLRG